MEGTCKNKKYFISWGETARGQSGENVLNLFESFVFWVA